MSICESAQRALTSALEEGGDAETVREFEIEVDVCQRLARDPAMESVWKSLHRKQKWQERATSYDRKLVHEIVREKLEAPNRSRLTDSKRRDLMEEIVAKARDLRKSVQEAAADRMGHWSAIDDGVQSDFFDALDQLIQEATRQADRRERRTKRTPSYVAIEMVRRLGPFVESASGRPLHQHVASIVNAVCDSNLSRDNVKSALSLSGASRARDRNQNRSHA